MSKLIEDLLAEEFKRAESESGRIARQIYPLMVRLIELDERKIAVLGELKAIVANKITERKEQLKGTK